MISEGCPGARRRYLGEAKYVAANLLGGRATAEELRAEYRRLVTQGVLPPGEPCAKCGYVHAPDDWPPAQRGARVDEPLP